MPANAPTYRLGPDFPDKLNRFLDHLLTDGYACFAQEFSQLDGYIAGAQAQNGPEKLRQTPKEKYLLELLSFAVYDRLNREAFNRTHDTLIIMPDCLSLHNPDCEKVEKPFGEICNRCTESCQAYQITELARQFHCKTVFAKRTEKEQLRYYADKLNDPGVIGIACVMMLADGMRAAAEVGLPARGVLLNFSGCEHWQDRPCASEFALDWLKTILNEKYATHNQQIDHR